MRGQWIRVHMQGLQMPGSMFEVCSLLSDVQYDFLAKCDPLSCHAGM